MKYFIILFSLLYSFSFSYHFINIDSKYKYKTASRIIQKVLKKKNFNIIKVIQYRNTKTIIILFDDKLFIKYFQNNHNLLSSLPFKVTVSNKIKKNKKDKNNSIISYEDFSELQRYTFKSKKYIEALAERMVKAIKEAKI